ncbi:MAG: type II secretion system protein N [Pseudomonadales bacterium]
MIRYVLVGIVVIIALLIYMAPATLLKQPLATVPDIDVQQLRGTLWQGQGLLAVAQTPLGDLHWRAQPTALLSGRMAASYQLAGSNLALTGEVAVATKSVNASTNGEVQAALINQLLADYELSMSGALEPEAVSVELVEQRVTALNGQIHWAGGIVSYALEGRQATQQLPPMRADLSLDEADLPLATIYSDGVNFPVLTLRLMDSGFVKVSLTRRFTQIVGMPWPGSEPDHAVVLEVEQQVF